MSKTKTIGFLTILIISPTLTIPIPGPLGPPHQRDPPPTPTPTLSPHNIYIYIYILLFFNFFQSNSNHPSSSSLPQPFLSPYRIGKIKSSKKLMGRSPCCEKAHTNKGAWTKDEDLRLINYIRVHGEGCWRSLPKAAGIFKPFYLTRKFFFFFFSF